MAICLWESPLHNAVFINRFRVKSGMSPDMMKSAWEVLSKPAPKSPANSFESMAMIMETGMAATRLYLIDLPYASFMSNLDRSWSLENRG